MTEQIGAQIPTRQYVFDQQKCNKSWDLSSLMISQNKRYYIELDFWKE